MLGVVVKCAGSWVPKADGVQKRVCFVHASGGRDEVDRLEADSRHVEPGDAIAGGGVGGLLSSVGQASGVRVPCGKRVKWAEIFWTC